MNKLGVQCQEKGEAIYEYNRTVQPNNIKAINIADEDFWRRIWDENPRLEYTIYRECSDQPDPFADPEGAAAAWAVLLESKVGHLVDAGLVTHVEGYNEWVHSFQTEQFPAADRFMAALIGEIHARFGGKVHAIVLNASCGHFSDDILEFPETLAKLNECGQCMLGLHEYDRDDMDRKQPWLCGKFQLVEQALRGAGYGGVKIAITELGLDDAVDRPEGSPHWGWRHYGATVEAAAAHFLDGHNLGWYCPLLAASEMTVLASIFGCQMFFADNWGEWGFDIAHGFPMLLEGIKELEAGTGPEPPENGGDEMDIVVVDLDYTERDFSYAREKYGVAFRRAEAAPGQKVYRLVELWEKTGNSSLTTKVLGADGRPQADVPVTFYWPDAPHPPDPPTEVYPHDWHDRFTWGLTNAEGDIGPGMGPGAYIDDIAEGGPHAVWVHIPDIPSDICERLGMLPGTVHDHLEPVFKLMTAGEGNGGGDMNDLIVVDRLEEPHVAAMLYIAYPVTISFDTRGRAGSSAAADLDTTEPDSYEYDGRTFACVGVCADFEGDAPREYWIEAHDLPSGKAITPRVTETFNPLPDRRKVTYVVDFAGESPEPEPPEPSEDPAQRLRDLGDWVRDELYGVAAGLSSEVAGGTLTLRMKGGDVQTFAVMPSASTLTVTPSGGRPGLLARAWARMRGLVGR